MVEIRKATALDLEYLWNRNIAENPGEECWIRWKKQFIDDNLSGAAATFALVVDDIPVGEATLLFSPDCRAIRGRLDLANGQTVTNINALRIIPEYQGKGYASALIREMETYALNAGYQRITIGVEAVETGNLAMYLHWGYNRFVMSEGEGMDLVLYFGKDLS